MSTFHSTSQALHQSFSAQTAELLTPTSSPGYKQQTFDGNRDRNMESEPRFQKSLHQLPSLHCRRINFPT